MAMSAKMVGKPGTKGAKLVVEIPLEEPRESASGKTMIVATSGGGKETEAEVDGKPIYVNLSAYYYPKARGQRA